MSQRTAFRYKCEKAWERHANVCPICDKTSPLDGVRLRSPGVPDGIIAVDNIEWQCPHCEAWINDEDELEDADLIR